MLTNGIPEQTFEPVDALVIGAGPIGIAAGMEAQRAGHSARIIEKGALTNSLVGYPPLMEFFSTPDLLEIGGYPMVTRGYKPLRGEAIEYYRRVAEAESLDIRLFERVQRVDGEDGAFLVVTDKGAHPCRKVVVSTGFFDQPNLLNVPGEDLPKVTHYYKEPYAYARRNVAVVGSKNSAAKAALECHRHGARVTLIVRRDTISERVKYWIRPDVMNRIAEGAITAHFNTCVTEIREDSLDLMGPDGRFEIANDVVLALTGYHPDFNFLETLGIDLEGPAQIPVYDTETMETNRAGVFLAGTVCGGRNTSRWFIENGRDHAKRIAARITETRTVTP
ncbi:YpdA family putative bacillithiol disulfide reductase [soil metagenome]